MPNDVGVLQGLCHSICFFKKNFENSLKYRGFVVGRQNGRFDGTG